MGWQQGKALALAREPRAVWHPCGFLKGRQVAVKGPVSKDKWTMRQKAQRVREKFRREMGRT